MPKILPLRWTQENQKFIASFKYTENLSPAWTTWNHILKKKHHHYTNTNILAPRQRKYTMCQYEVGFLLHFYLFFRGGILQHTSEGQRTTSRSLFSPPTMQLLGMELRLSALAAEHLSSPEAVFYIDLPELVGTTFNYRFLGLFILE